VLVSTISKAKRCACPYRFITVNVASGNLLRAQQAPPLVRDPQLSKRTLQRISGGVRSHQFPLLRDVVTEGAKPR
jgi:hypothetical protein